MAADGPSRCSIHVRPVVDAARDVSLDLDRLAEHAGWMAYEELPPPAFILPFPLELDRDGIVDFVLTATCINFAFTDFETRVRWEVEHDGRALADADGMHFCLQRALAEGVPVTDGAWLSEGHGGAAARCRSAAATRSCSSLDERARIWREVGASARRALRRAVLERLQHRGDLRGVPRAC